MRRFEGESVQVLCNCNGEHVQHEFPCEIPVLPYVQPTSTSHASVSTMVCWIACHFSTDKFNIIY